MKAYLRWSKVELNGIEALGLEFVLTEVGDEGSVEREVGLDSKGQVIYFWPSSSCPKQYRRGLFDGAKTSVKANQEILASNEFAKYWERL